ncbi:uncharacterized protein LOC136069469 [Quercus suber]|uniref:uncharacterized protein LOC136069469 n=1 Tax=Quercus suber TaxID=58331 RepID=UPI0032DE4486
MAAAAMLHDQPLMDNASIRESQGDEGALVAEALEKSLLLPIDMAELEKMSGVEVVFDLKKYLGMAIQALFRLGEEVGDHSHALAQERDKFLEAAKTLKRSEADLKKATEDLAEMAKARDTAVSDLAVVRKQVEDQTVHLQEVESQLQKAKEDISYMKGSLTKAIHDKGVAEYARDEAVRARDEQFLQKQTLSALHYCSQTWHEALNQAGIDASSDLRREDRVYYPTAIREVTPAAPEGESSLPSVESQDKTAEDAPLIGQPSEEVEPRIALGEVVTEGQERPQDVASPPTDF